MIRKSSGVTISMMSQLRNEGCDFDCTVGRIFQVKVPRSSQTWFTFLLAGKVFQGSVPRKYLCLQLVPEALGLCTTPQQVNISFLLFWGLNTYTLCMDYGTFKISFGRYWKE